MTPFDSTFLPSAPNVWAGTDKRIVTSDSGYTYLFAKNPPERSGFGSLRFHFALAVIREVDGTIMAIVTSETEEGQLEADAFLCAFTAHRHLNFGLSSDWLDEQKFLNKAMNIARPMVKHLGRVHN